MRVIFEVPGISFPQEILTQMSWPFEEVRFHAGLTHKFEIENNCISIYINKRDAAIQDPDNIKVIIFRELALGLMKTRGISADIWIIDYIRAYRLAIKSGLEKALVNYFFSKLLSYKNEGVNSSRIFLELNIPWIVFVSHDPYISEMFRNSVRNIAYNRDLDVNMADLLDALSSNLENPLYLSRAIGEYSKLRLPGV